MPESRNRSPATRHGFTSLLTLLAVGAALYVVTANDAPDATAEIQTLETVTSSSASLEIAISRGTASGMVQLTAGGSAPVWMSLPATWTLKEVRNGELSEVQSRTASGAMSAWRFPQGMTVSFWMPETPEHVSIRHRSPFPLQIIVKHIDMIEQKIDTDVRLLSGSTMVVW